MTDTQLREYIQLVVKAAVEEFNKQVWPSINKRIDEKVEHHSLTCDTTKFVQLTKARLFGIGVGLTIGGGTVGAIVIKLITAII